VRPDRVSVVPRGAGSGTDKLAVQRATTYALDPQGLINPGGWLAPVALGAR
jgi:hypothetical protein